MCTVAFELLEQALLVPDIYWERYIKNEPICHNPTCHRKTCHRETGHTAHLVQCHLKIGILAEGTFSSLGFPGITNVDTGSTDTQITKFLDVGCLDNFSFCFCFSVL